MNIIIIFLVISIVILYKKIYLLIDTLVVTLNILTMMDIHMFNILFAKNNL